MGSPWKANLMIVEEKYCSYFKAKIIPTEIAEYFNLTLPALSAHLRIFKDADLITEKKQGKNRSYSLNTKRTLKLIEFFEEMYDYNLNSLKEYVETKNPRSRCR